MKIGQEGLV